MYRGFVFSHEGIMPKIRNVMYQQGVSGNKLSLSHCLPEHWALDYTLEYSGKCKCNNTPWLPRPEGVAHLYPPGTVYHEDYRDIDKFSSVYIVFSGELEMLRKLTGNAYRFARIIDRDRHLQKLLVNAAETASRTGSSGYFKTYEIFCQILELLKTLSPAGNNEYTYSFDNMPGGNSHELIAKAKDYLERNYLRKLTLSEVARHCGVSVSSLSHRFKMETGSTVFECLLRIRAEQSVALLNTGKTLKEIAAVTGFSDEFYYSRVFKRIFGCSPSCFRKAQEGLEH